MSFALYMLGYALFIAGAAIGAHLLNVPPQWIGVVALCLLGIGVAHGVTATRHRDSS